ncbi:hypothetical protein GOODEAATRI_014207 [Goodea atripinnis]|uniref:Uncharacterized protein n=1 Tax=Goodea atripinnis TaxID=208336 RepID=A0ABV0PXX4_9TELE
MCSPRLPMQGLAEYVLSTGLHLSIHVSCAAVSAHYRERSNEEESGEEPPPLFSSSGPFGRLNGADIPY